MKLIILVLAAGLTACTRTVSVSPVMTPPVTLIVTPETLTAEPATDAAPTLATATSNAAPESERLPAGEIAADPLAAPSGAWTIWRRGPEVGHLFRADASGQTIEIRLPALEGTRPSPEYSLSPDGRLIFYTLLDSNGGVIARQLAAYEFVTGRLQTAALDPSRYTLVDFGALQAAFEPGGARIAVTLEGFPLSDNSKNAFRVYLWDLESNEATEALTSETAYDRDLLPEDHTPLVAQWMAEGVLLVGHLPESTTYSDTLLWQPDSRDGDLSVAGDASVGFALRGQRLSGGGEVVWPEYDESFPALPLECWGTRTPDNVLKLTDLETKDTRVIFAAGAGEQIGQVRWLDGGERLALLMVGCDQGAARLLTLDRRGAVADTVPVAGELAVFASGNDLIVLTEDLSTGVTTIIAYDSQQQWAAREVASFAGTLGSAGYAFDFVTDAAARPDLDPFPTVGAEASRTGLEIGRRATVASSTGVLNIRTEPSQEAPALGLLPAGAEVTILDGPVAAANGLVYWQVETDDGLIGWCVESVEGEQTLIPKP